MLNNLEISNILEVKDKSVKVDLNNQKDAVELKANIFKNAFNNN